MTSKTIQVFRLDDGSSDFTWLFRLWQDHQNYVGELVFDFTFCSFIGQGAVAFIGGLMRLLEARGCVVRLKTETLRPAVHANLAQNGFLHAFGSPHQPWQGNSVPFRHDQAQDPHGFANYLEQMWLGKNWIKVSDALRGAMVSRLSEAYTNVFEHAQSPVGLFSCGQHFPNKHLLKLTLVDFGVGIPSNVRMFFQRTKSIAPEHLPADVCLNWAFRQGTSTQPGGRGLGLDLLTSFVRLNEGRMEIFSHEAHAIVTKDGVVFQTREPHFEGTLVNILLRCDTRYYYLKSEQTAGPPF